MQNKANILIILLILVIGLSIFSYVKVPLSTSTAEPTATIIPDCESLSFRVMRLEDALAPKTPLGAVKTWAEGVKLRNGALQYAVFTEPLRKEKYDEFSGLNWATGTSSPWVKSYTITKTEENQYQIEFLYTDSTNATTTVCQAVTVTNVEDKWLISSISDC